MTSRRSLQSPAGRRAGRGMGLVEVLISLSISAALLVAVAAAYSASSSIIEANDQFFRDSQAGRITIGQMLAAVRTCKSVTVFDDRIEVTDIDNKLHIYRYNATTGQMLYYPTGLMTDPFYVMAENVELPASPEKMFDAPLIPDPKTQIGRPARVAVTFVIDSGDNQMRLSGSASPRVYISY